MEFNGINFDTYFKNYPNSEGYYGKYGGAYISDELKQAMAEINEAYFTICKSSKFISELRKIRKEFQGRPTPISYLERLSTKIGLTKNTDPVKIEFDLKKLIPPERQLKLCHQFVNHGRLRCIARRPDCENCEIKEYCKSARG